MNVRHVVIALVWAVSLVGVGLWAQAPGAGTQSPSRTPGTVAGTQSPSRTPGTVAGVVEDAQGGVIPGVTVELISDSRGLRGVQTVTNVSGEFVLPNVVPDTYTVEASMPGFRTLRRPGVRVSGGDRIVVPTIVLEVAQMSRFMRPGEAVGPVIAGPDIGFQPVYSVNVPAGAVAGRWMVRVNGQWLEAMAAFRTVPAR